MLRMVGLLLLVASIGCATLSTVNLASAPTYSMYSVSQNPLGVTFDLPELLPYFSNQLLQQYMLNSNLQGNWGANFEQTVHVPPGYKYNCSLLANLTSSPVNCTVELSNLTLLAEIGHYIYNTTMYYGFNIGWDQQGATFTSNYTTAAFLPFFQAIASFANQPFNVEMADRANLYSALNIRPNYTATQFIQDCNAVNNALNGVNMAGPGTTGTADSSWYAINGQTYYYCGFFTIRAVVFPNASDVTIANLLSERYTSEFLKRRMTVNGTSYLRDFNYYLGSISDLRLVDDPMGVPGLTNSFAACIWAIEIAMEFFFVDGFRIDFYNSFRNGSAQGLFGPFPSLAPTPLYHALLFLDLALLDGPYIESAPIVSGTSSSIKVYGLDFITNYGVILLNKDMNSSHSGEVKVSIADKSGLFCVYLTAPDLSSTGNVTIGGIHFVPNQSKYAGVYQEYQYVSDGTAYSIPLNYSQAAYCYTKVAFTYNPFPIVSASASAHHIIFFISLLLFLLLVISS